MHKFKIVANERGRGSVEMDGKRVDGVVDVQVEIAIGKVPIVRLTLLGGVEIETASDWRRRIAEGER